MIAENVQDTKSLECDMAATVEAGTIVLDARFAIGNDNVSIHPAVNDKEREGKSTP